MNTAQGVTRGYQLKIRHIDVGGIVVAVTHQQEGLLFPMGDLEAFLAHLRHLITNPDERNRLGTAARHKAETEYSVEAMVTKTEAIFKKVVQHL